MFLTSPSHTPRFRLISPQIDGDLLGFEMVVFVFGTLFGYLSFNTYRLLRRTTRNHAFAPPSLKVKSFQSS